MTKAIVSSSLPFADISDLNTPERLTAAGAKSFDWVQLAFPFSVTFKVNWLAGFDCK